MSTPTRARREEIVTRLLHRLTCKLRALPGRLTERDHARIIVGRYCRAIGLPQQTGGEPLLEYLCTWQPFLLKIEEIDKMIFPFAQPAADLQAYARAAASAASAIARARSL